MSIIEVTNIEYPGYFECCDEECKYRKECAQHETAGFFRTEDGFTPELLIIGNLCYCDTKDRASLKGLSYEDLPDNYDELSHGALMSDRCGMLVLVSFQDDKGWY